MSARDWRQIVIDGQPWPYEIDARGRVRRQAGSVTRRGHLYNVRGGLLNPSRGRFTLSRGRGRRIMLNPATYRGGSR